MDQVLTFRGGAVPVSAVVWRFSPSGGPGGQHANRSNTRVEGVVDLATAGDMAPEVRQKLIDRLGDELRVVVDDTRSQARNREIALDRLEKRLRSGIVTAKPRKPTRFIATSPPPRVSRHPRVGGRGDPGSRRLGRRWPQGGPCRRPAPRPRLPAHGWAGGGRRRSPRGPRGGVRPAPG